MEVQSKMQTMEAKVVAQSPKTRVVVRNCGQFLLGSQYKIIFSSLVYRPNSMVSHV
jgi:hypothetical protein